MRTPIKTTPRTRTAAIRQWPRRWTIVWTIVLGLALAGGLGGGRAEALTVSGFMDLCKQSGRPCEEVPLLQAYVGGALDLIAVLHEETDYIQPVYCKDPRVLFDVAAIIGFIENRREGYEQRNAMLLVVRFLEEHGGC